MLRLYGIPTSGNCYKVELLLKQLGIPYEGISVNSRQGENRLPEYLAKNPFGQIPALELESGVVLAESAAILVYLAEDTPMYGQTKLERAEILKWLFFEQTRIARYIATTRFWVRAGQAEANASLIEQNLKLGTDALRIMNTHLEGKTFFVGERYTIADVALFTYTHVAEQGGFDLKPFPSIQAWCQRVQETDQFFPLPGA
ncbi:glutathione S-transferase family protein [Thermostichus vulcanus]|uniref:Glutathione S-transferase family protein n=1 Tax=Thermostichus vulcanus str. 'Rupite' TaxID=2813851 RepID=A0ABT0CD13_THEVL|nr:glutathione S-transferase family protein [Thermostichus vulcanus]MCJ2543676.1 glutathione S-transferase family protein [Thermostichus vulcanus str. 'Rupite']